MVKVNQIAKPATHRLWSYAIALVTMGVIFGVILFPDFKKTFFPEKQTTVSIEPMPVLYALQEFEFTDFDGNITRLEIFVETERAEQLNDIRKEENKINQSIMQFAQEADIFEKNTKILQAKLLTVINQTIAPLQIKKIYLNRFNP